MSLPLRHARAHAPRWWAIVLLLIAALPLASARTGATGTVFTATTVVALIADINAANASPAQGPYTINLTVGGLYTLVAEAATGSGTGLPAIASGVDLTIAGNGATIQRSTAGGTPDFRILFVTNGATVRLNALALRNGSVVGAAGATRGPGFPGDTGGNASGGAIFNSGSLTVSGGTFANNRAVGGAGGDGGTGADRSGTVGGTGGEGGAAGGATGGAVSNLGTLVAMGSVFSGNTARGGAGGAGGTGGNSIGAGAGMGGNAGRGGDATGGALNNGGALTVTNSTFTGNAATGGAGGDGGSAGAGTTGGNAGMGATGGVGEGGAIADPATGTLTVTNGTIAGNSATGGAGGTGFGGTLAAAPGSGGGLRTPGGGVTARNTILAANTALSDGNCGNFVSDGGNNIEFNPATTCGFANPQTGDSLLGALANHGGPTPTIALGIGSAAMNTGNPTLCAGTSGVAPVGGVDQRGLPRPAGRCSIGAFEPQPAPFPTLDTLSASSGSTTGGTKMTLSGTGFVNGVGVVFGTVSATVTAVTNGTTIAVIMPAHPAGTVDVTVTNPDAQAATLSAGYTFGTVAPLPGPRQTVSPAATKPRPLPASPRPIGTPSGGGTPLPLPPPR